MEEPLLSIVLVEALCEDGLLLCSKVSSSLLFKHAIYKGIFNWHIPLHNVQFVKYDVTVSFMAQVLNTVTYLVPHVLDTAS